MSEVVPVIIVAVLLVLAYRLGYSDGQLQAREDGAFEALEKLMKDF